MTNICVCSSVCEVRLPYFPKSWLFSFQSLNPIIVHFNILTSFAYRTSLIFAYFARTFTIFKYYCSVTLTLLGNTHVMSLCVLSQADAPFLGMSAPISTYIIL